MYWYTRKLEDSPREILQRIAKMDAEIVTTKNGERKSKFELMDSDAQVKITRQAKDWTMARGRNLFQPNHLTFWWFLAVSMIKFAAGGNRSGKTATAAVDVVAQCEGWHPLQRNNLNKLRKEALDEYVYWDNFLRQYRKIDAKLVKQHCEWVLDNRLWIADPPITARCVAVDFPNGVEKFCGPEVMRWATNSEIKYKGFDNEKKRRIDWKNGSLLEFMTTDQELDAHGGTARHVVWFDEEPPASYWQENMMRIISVKGRMILAMTSVNGITWVKQKIWDEYEKQLKERGLAA